MTDELYEETPEPEFIESLSNESNNEKMELKLCPFCKSKPKEFEVCALENHAGCTNEKCIARVAMPVSLWNTRPIEDALRAENDALREEVNKLGNGVGDGILEIMKLRAKLDIAVNLLERLRHWDMLWLGIGQPSLVADGLYWKREIDEALEKLEV